MVRALESLDENLAQSDHHDSLDRLNAIKMITFESGLVYRKQKEVYPSQVGAIRELGQQ